MSVREERLASGTGQQGRQATRGPGRQVFSLPQLPTSHVHCRCAQVGGQAPASELLTFCEPQFPYLAQG